MGINLNIYKPLHQPYAKFMACNNTPCNGANPCGAAGNVTGPYGAGCHNTSWFDEFDDCDSGQAIRTGYCCDMLSRSAGHPTPSQVGQGVGAWASSLHYERYDTAFGIKGDCTGCPVTACCDHTSTNSKRACKSGWSTSTCGYGGNPGVSVWRWWCYWSPCYFRINPGCTNPNSYLGGSPNGTCMENCIQAPGYITDGLPAGYNSEQDHCNFDRDANFDCEAAKADDDGGQLWPTGPKLIFMNIDSTYQWGNTYNPTSSSPSSRWRRLGPDTAARGSKGYDGCCTYLSFGCPDSNFGSYNAQAQLDCAGNYIGSRAYLNQPELTNIQSNDPYYNPPFTNPYNFNPDPGPWAVSANGPFDLASPPLSSWSPSIDCERCWDDSITPPVPCTSASDPACAQTGTNPGCTQAIWDACGLDGNFKGGVPLSSYVCSSSRVFEGKDETATSSAPTAAYLNSLPCVCNNAGCMDGSQINGSYASGYSPLNSLDCTEVVDPATGQDYTDATQCCEWTVYGCSTQNSTVNGNENYFCCQGDDGTAGTSASNWLGDYCSTNPTQEFIGDNNAGGWGDGTVNGGNCNSTLPVTNITLVDDGSCSLNITPGCMDDGGPLAGGAWPAPIYPGYQASNYDPTATVHMQVDCEYDKGCIDPLAIGVTATVGILCGGGTFTIPSTTVIPSAECCDYQLVGVGPGCTDPMALNYNPLADPDDGSCLYPTPGCTDPDAINYNPTAIIDDGSCEYLTDYPEVGTNFLDGTPIELCMEPLTKEEVLINVCQPTEIQSDVFIERGKQSVLSPNQRLGEVKTIGGLEDYGYGYYNIKNEG